MEKPKFPPTYPPTSVSGPRPAGRGVSISITSDYPDFLLYLSTAVGGKSVRNLMIPNLIENLKELGPSDSFYSACEKTNRGIRMELKQLGPEIRQLPKIESTLEKKFCIGKKFLSTEYVAAVARGRLEVEGAAAAVSSADK